MEWLFSLLAKIFVGSFDAWMKNEMAKREAEQLGAARQAASTEAQAQEKVRDAQVAGNAVAPVTLDDVRNGRPGSDPDFVD